MSEEKVLVVDDEWLNREMLEGLLSAHGFEVKLAHNAETALSMLENDQPGLMLVDVRMPGIDGYALSRRIKDTDAYREIVVVLVTALEIGPEETRAARESGADAIVDRGMPGDRLVTHLRSLLDADVEGRPIAVGEHCYGCTAGQGSSCGGQTA